MPVTGDSITYFINFETNADVAIVAARKRVDTEMEKVRKRFERTRMSMKGLRGGLKKTGAAVQRLAGRWLAMAGTIASTAAVFKSVSDAQKFGIAIAEIGTIFSGTEEQLAAVEERILSFSEALGLNEATVAKSFYQIISADITEAAEAAHVLTESLELATVGLADAKQTIDVVTSVIKAYGVEVSEAGRITDVLFQTVIKGKTTIPELATSLGQVLPIAATLGIRLEEVTAAIATLTQGGIETNTAVIQLRQAFNQMLKPSAEATTLMAQYGLNIDAARLRTDGFAVVLTELREKLGNNATAYAKIFGNIRALIPILALTGERYEQFNAVLEANEGALGRVDESLQKLLANPFKRFQVFFNALRIKLRAVGEVFIREINRVIDERGGIDAIASRFGVAFATLEGVAKGVADAFGRVIDFVTILVTRFGGLQKARAIFESIGVLIGATIERLVKAFLDGVALIIEAVIRLFQLLDEGIESSKRGVNQFAASLDGIKIPGFGRLDIDTPFPEVIQKDALKAEIDEALGIIQRATEEANRRLPDLLEAFAIGEERGEAEKTLAGYYIIQAEMEELIEIAKKAEEVISKAVATGEEAGFGSLDPRKLDNLNLALQGFEKLSETMKDADQNFKDALSGVKQAFAALAFAGGQADLVVRGELVLEVDPAQAAEAARKAAEDARRAMQDEINLILSTQTLLTGAEFHSVDVGSARFPQAESTLTAIRDQFAQATGVTIAPGFDAAGMQDAISRFSQLLNLVSDLNEMIADGPAQELAALERTALVRKQLFEASLIDLALTADAHREIVDLWGQAEDAQRRAAIGFESFPQFFAQLSGDAQVPWDVTVAGIAESRKELEAFLAGADKLGLLSPEDLARLGAAIDANIVSQLEAAAEQARKVSQALLRDDEAFGRDSAVGRLQQALRDSAAAAARAKTEIRDLTVEGSADFTRLAETYEDTLRSMNNGFDSFGAGMLARLHDIREELGDMASIGARFADDLAGSFGDAYRERIVGELLNAEDRVDAAKAALAEGLANTLANALATRLQTLTIDLILQPIGEAIFGDALRDLIGQGEEAVSKAQEQVALTTLQAAATTLTTGASQMVIAGGVHQAAAAGLGGSAGALTAAAAALAATAGLASGGFTQGPAVQGFAAGTSTIPKRLSSIAAGGVKTQEVLTRVREGHQNEAVVPLPGNGRSIPVELRDPNALSRGGGIVVHQEAHLHLNVVSDDASFTRKVAAQMPMVEKMLTATLSTGGNSALEQAIARSGK